MTKLKTNGKPFSLRPTGKVALTEQQIAEFKELIQSGLEVSHAAEALGINSVRYPKQLAAAARDALKELRLSLFRAMLQATKDSASAAIFASKAKLGWQDVQKVEQVQVVEYIDLPIKETRGEWEKRQGLRSVKAS